MKFRYPFLLILLLGMQLACSSTLFAQDFRTKSKKQLKQKDSIEQNNSIVSSRIITGIIKDKKRNEALPLATIIQLGTSNGALSDEYGAFSIKLDLKASPILICTYFGFENDSIVINENTGTVKFMMIEKFFTINDIVISVSRKNERKFESPITVETLSAKDLQYNSSLNLYERMAMLTSVNVITTSFNFKAINTRGFNSSYNTRFIQRYDNMDLSMPGFNLSAGLLNGPIDMDVERAELIPGANSALYGPNAINGLMNISAKSPFLYPGLSVNLKTGVNHVDGVDHAPGLVQDFAFRFAKIITPKFAAKITVGYQKANDWQGTDYQDVADYRLSDNNTSYGYKPGIGNPGYDGVSTAGDEVAGIIDTSTTVDILGVKIPLLPKGPLKIARTGYKETELFEYKPYSFKTDIGFAYKVNPSTELSFTSRFSTGSSTFQIANRAQVKDFLLQQHKVELKGKNYALRAYANFENIGETFDISLAAININRAAKSDENWFMQYALVYSGKYNDMAKFVGITDTLAAGNDEVARRFADSDNRALYDSIKNSYPDIAYLLLGGGRLIPGTAAFDSVYRNVRTTTFNKGGGGLISHSKTWYAEFIYDFAPYIKSVSLIAGANYRLHTPISYGSVFNDATKSVYSNEVGCFLQAGKKLYHERLQLQASGRLDYLQRFDPRFSPRVSVVYLAGDKRQHSFRLSGQIGFRSPTLMDQFFYMNIPGVVTFGGFLQDAKNLNLVFTPANSAPIANLYTMYSVNEFLYTGDSSKLVRPVLKDIKPEELRTVELGWRTFLSNKLETDINFYLISFRNLINSEQYIGPKILSDTLNAQYLKNKQGTMVYRRAINSESPLNSFGFSISANYYLNKNWTLFGNYNLNTLLNANDYSQSFVTSFNTPRNKVNLGFRALNLFKGIGIASNYQWVESYFFKEYSRSGMVDAYYYIDMNLNYMLPKQKLLFKLGGTNITNNRYIQALGSPTVGAIFYFSILYDAQLN
jgi:iron complex outermembrane receptor protein